jgi:hypothetical protein
MSLFTKLQSLSSDRINRLEDYHTEIVACVLQNSPELTRNWLAKLGLPVQGEGCEVLVRTQENLGQREDPDDSGSRPDIVICIESDRGTDLTYIESKIGSKQGKSQLLRYANDLAENKRVSKRSLVYITRDFEHAEDPKVEGVVFERRRWYEFYQFLKDSEPNPTGINKELILFMEENNMSQSDQFSPIDILALSNFRKARKIMDQTMWEGVSATLDPAAVKFKRVAGGVSSRNKASTQLGPNNRYIMYVGHGEGWQFDILLGYYLNEAEVTGYPEVGVQLDVSPKARARDAIASAMQDFAKRKGDEWKTWGLADKHKWGGIKKTKSLQEFLSKEHQIEEVARYFALLLDEVKEFRDRNPTLPWKAQEKEQEAI